jgi:hypothetical protein
MNITLVIAKTERIYEGFMNRFLIIVPMGNACGSKIENVFLKVSFFFLDY